MPYLYCDKHGHEREADIIKGQGKYRQADEIVLVVSGTLIGGPWQCDSCNASTQEGQPCHAGFCFPQPLPG